MKLMALIIFISIIGTACTSIDNRERIAMATLYPDAPPAGEVHSAERAAPVLTSALNSKFPPGTDLESLKNYVAKLGGTCHGGQATQPLFCSFIETGAFCIQTSVAFTVQTDGMGKIEHIKAVRIVEGC